MQWTCTYLIVSFNLTANALISRKDRNVKLSLQVLPLKIVKSYRCSVCNSLIRQFILVHLVLMVCYWLDMQFINVGCPMVEYFLINEMYIWEHVGENDIIFIVEFRGIETRIFFFSNRWLLIIKKYMFHEVLVWRPPAMSGLGDDVRAQ